MNPAAQRFIELATRPLGDNAELQLSAEAELRKSIEANAGKPEALAEAADSLARSDGHPNRRRWRVVLVMVMLLVSLPLLFFTRAQFLKVVRTQLLFSSTATPDSVTENMPRLGEQQKLLLLGASGASRDADKWKPLWDSEPENPAYLAEYATAYFKDHKKLSPEILAAAERVDRDNAWFPALAAAGIAEGAVTKKREPYTSAKAPAKTPVWIIDNEQRLKDALAAIHRLKEKPRFTAYQNELLRQRIPLFPPRRDFVSGIPPLAYVTGLPSPGIHFRKLSDVLAAGAQQCAVNGDAAGFRQIVEDWKSLVAFTSKNGDTMIDLLIAKAVFGFPAANFRDAAKTLGLQEEAEYFTGIHDRWQEDRDSRDPRLRTMSAAERAGHVLVAQRASALASLSIPMMAGQVKFPPVLTGDDLRPGRYAEHALLERFGSWLAWGLLGICAGFSGLNRYRQSLLTRRLSGRIEDLFRLSDWAWTILGGVVLPMLWYFLITRLTPLGAREWSARMTLFIQPGGQFGCMALSMIILPVVIASRRLAKRGAALGLAPRFPWLGWVAAASALGGVPVYGALIFPEGIGALAQITAFALSGIAGAWILVGMLLSGFGRGAQALRRATLARLVAPVWVAGMLLLVALVPFYHAEERRWIQQDRLFEISVDAPAPSRYEYEITQILRRELLEMIGSTDSAR